MIRALQPSDTSTLVEMARETGAFKSIEIEALQEVLDDYHAANAAAGHRAVVIEKDRRVVGFGYFAESAMTDRTWSLWWIVVDRQMQGRGLGGELLRYAESVVKSLAGRQLLIETSSLPKYEPARRFYLKNGYAQAAVVKDFYAEGDDLVYFAKHI